MVEKIQSEYPDDHVITDVDLLANEPKTNFISSEEKIVQQMAEAALHKQEEESIARVLESLKK